MERSSRCAAEKQHFVDGSAHVGRQKQTGSLLLVRAGTQRADAVDSARLAPGPACMPGRRRGEQLGGAAQRFLETQQQTFHGAVL